MPTFPNQNEWRVMAEVGTVGTMATNDFMARAYEAETVSQIKYGQRRIRQFTASGLLEKTDVIYNAAGGIRKMPSVLRLTPTGGKEVEDNTGYLPPRLATSDPPTIPTLMHRVGVSRILLKFKDATKQEGLAPAEWILEYDRYSKAKASDKHHKQFVLHEYFGSNGNGSRVTCRADASVLLRLPTGHVMAAYLEYDRGTDKSSQLLAKVAGYHCLLDPATHAYRKHWPAAQFARVLFVATSKQRLDNVLRLLSGRPGAEYFRLALEEELYGNFLRRPIWRSPDDCAATRAIIAG